MTSKQDKQGRLTEAVTSLRRAVPKLRGALIATTDGLPIAQSFDDRSDADRVAAMAATAVGLGRRINHNLGTGDLTELSVLASGGQVSLYVIGKKGVLAVVSPMGMNLGVVNMEAREVADEVALYL
ncbi:roadblock/LC7 domain-containing protein [Deinococcus lacus]|uniref:Roadblock/LC7 domain-containing protein n=1 Tax=Deinococcus lacus TaxID=392561 RepID=A0ABW1YIZ0_9DEIO